MAIMILMSFASDQHRRMGFGLAEMGQAPAGGREVRVGIVQANVPQDEKWSPGTARSILEQHERMTEQAAAADRVAQLSANGTLNVSGMETALNLRTQFGFKLPMGAALKPYYDVDYYRAAGGK